MTAESILPNRARTMFFLGVALTIVAIWVGLLRADHFARHPMVGAWGATIDLIITIPLVYYFLLIRPGRASIRSMVVVVVGSRLVAGFVVPHDHRGLLMVLEAGAEIAIIGFVVVRARRAIRHARDGRYEQPLDAVAAVLGEVAPNRILAEVILSEISIAWYAFLSWRRERIEKEHAFAWACVGDWSSVILGLGLVIALESSAVHLWLMQRHPLGAWILTALDLYGLLWLVADFRALRLSSVELGGDRIEIRFGFRWSASIDLGAVEKVERIAGDEKAWDLKMSLVEAPRILVTLREPTAIRGPYGIRRRAKRIGLRVEDEPRFEARARSLGLWSDPEPDPGREQETVPARETVEAPRFRMSRRRWLETRPDYISLEEWERHRPDWVDPR